MPTVAFWYDAHFSISGAGLGFRVAGKSRDVWIWTVTDFLTRKLSTATARSPIPIQIPIPRLTLNQTLV